MGEGTTRLARYARRAIEWQRRIGAASALAVLAIVAGPSAVGALPPEARPMLATGDVIPRFGRVGLARFAVHGIDDRGRLLVSGESSQGGYALVWAGSDGVDPLWSSAEGPELALDRFAVSGSGFVVGWSPTDDAIVRFGPDGPVAVIAAGQVLDDGATVCSTDIERAVDDRGTVAATAAVAPPGTGCDEADLELVIATDTEVQHFPIRPSDWRFLGLGADGSAYFTDRGAVVAFRDGQRRIVVSAGAHGPTGAELTEIRGLRASPGGVVVFEAIEDGRLGLYRSMRRTIDRIVAIGDRLPGGGVVTDFDGPVLIDHRVAVNNAGDVAFEALIFDEDAVVVARDGLPLALAAIHAKLFGLNATGEAGLYSERWASRVSADRWSSGQLETMLTGHTGLPGGGGLVTLGIDAAQLTPDGRVVAQVVNPEWQRALVCADAHGAVAVVLPGDAAPDGGLFVDIDGLRFVDATTALFVAARGTEALRRVVDEGIYAATPNGIVPLIGPGASTEHGAIVLGLLGMDHGPYFAHNRRGSVVALASVDLTRTVVRRRPGGGIEALDLEAAGCPPAKRLLGAGIAADDTVVISLARPDGGNALVVSDGASCRVLATDDAPGERFGTPLVSDQIVALPVLQDGAWTWSRIDLQNGARAPLPIPPDPSARPERLRQLTRAGQVLFNAPLADGSEGVFVAGGDGIQLLGPSDAAAEGAPVSINDRGNVLWKVSQSPVGTDRHSLHLEGPPPEADCFVPPPSPPSPLEDPAVDWLNCRPDGPCVSIEVEVVSGLPGETITLRVRLETGVLPVAGTQNDLSLPPVLQRSADMGRPRCRVNPAIDKTGSAFAYLPAGCVDCPRMRALVLSLENVDPIPSGSTLYECDFEIAPDAAPGRYPVELTNAATAGPDGFPLPTDGRSGFVEVLAAHDVAGGDDGAAPVAGGTFGAGGGCTITAAPSPGIGLILGTGLSLLAIARRRTSRA